MDRNDITTGDGAPAARAAGAVIASAAPDRADGPDLHRALSRRGCTHLGVGPMSVNCVDAAIELANDYDVPLILIASRRQIECLELGGGYVNNWDTFSFARYVRERDRKGRIILARDHGGPWQHPLETERFPDVGDAMESSKLSFLRDLEAGFQILHIDPVVDIERQTPTVEWILEKVFELYAYCVDISRSLNREILVELGTEEQQQSPIKDPQDLRDLIDEVRAFCDRHRYPYPSFMVVQTGTKVMGLRNVGDFPALESEIEAYVQRHRLAEIVQICEQRGVMLKEHNTDYLPDVSLRFHPRIGIHAANVAPEFGVAETRALIEAMNSLSLTALRDRFMEICVASRKWVKWIQPGSSPDDLEKTLICGHYNFSDERTVEIKRQVAREYARRGRDLETDLKAAVKRSILRYMLCFRLVAEG